jgi:hypothetical protein
VKAGDRAQVTLPGNTTVTGKVVGFGRIAQAPAEQDSSAADATIPAYISLDDPSKARGLDKAPVQLDITTAGVESALSVPVTALVGKSGGGFAVEMVRAGERRDLVAVTPSAATVRPQVTNGGGGMPAFENTLSRQQIAGVAAYVARVAGRH